MLPAGSQECESLTALDKFLGCSFGCSHRTPTGPIEESFPIDLWISWCCSSVVDRVAGRMGPVKLVHDGETEPTSFQLNLRKDV